MYTNRIDDLNYKKMDGNEKGGLYDFNNILEKEFIIQPHILPPRGLLVFGGAEKVGKTDFLLNWLAHMAAGLPFLEMTPPRPLKIVFLQEELDYISILKRQLKKNFDQNALALIEKNLHVTPQIQIFLNDEGIETVRDYIIKDFNPDEIDIIAIDLPGTFYEGKDEIESSKMLIFLQNRAMRLRDMINPKISIIITHLTPKNIKKISELKGYSFP